MELVISKIIREITPFGYYKGDDLKQQAFVFGIEAMNTEKYNPAKPLGAFLRVCIVNRIISLSRDKYSRNEPPCRKCPFADDLKKNSDSGCNAFGNKLDCSKFKTYYERNQSKRNLMNLKSKTPLYEDTASCSYRPFLGVDNKDYIDNLMKYLTKKAKATLYEILEGKEVSKKRLDNLREEVNGIIPTSREV